MNLSCGLAPRTERTKDALKLSVRDDLGKHASASIVSTDKQQIKRFHHLLTPKLY